MDEDDLLAFGDLEIEEDTSVADARAARIAAARAQAKQYSAKIEEPGWFNDPVEVARVKDPTRAKLFSLHQLYFEQRWAKVLEGGLELCAQGNKEEGEVMDLVMRSWQKLESKDETKRDQVVKVAKRWREYPNQASICHISAQILSSAAFPSRLDPLTFEALSASLASLRLNRSQPPFLATLQEILDASHPLLASALKDRSVAANKREEVVAELDRLALDEKERETLERVLGLHGEEKEIEEDVGRDVRSL
ncbi:hypothetical protein JCM16303_004966 [Sporobolomyces ruberrimus]